MQLRIITQNLGKIPFQLFPFQYSVLKALLTHRYTITLKPRQMGMTTLLAAYVLWLAMFHPDKEILIISLQASVAKQFLLKVKNMYKSLPEYLAMNVINGTYGEVGTVTEIRFENGSRIYVSASTPNAGRSETLSFAVIDEAAFQRYAEENVSSMMPALNFGGGCAILSTAFGMGNFFHDEWTRATQGLGKFFPIKLNWRLHPYYTQKWYKEQLTLMGPKRVAQEIDCDFLQSGYNVFNVAKIRAIEDRLREMEPVETRERGKLLIYRPPVRGVKYFIGADVASGRSRDYSAFSVMDRNGVDHAVFKDHVIPVNYGRILGDIGAVYNFASIGCEINGVGEGVVAKLQSDAYPNLYYSTSKILKLGDFEHDQSLIAGWVTTGKSRHNIITGLDGDIEDELVEINDPYFVKEAMTFVYDSMNRPVARGKGNKSRASIMYEDQGSDVITYSDDAILGKCITNEIRKDPRKFEGHLHIG